LSEFYLDPVDIHVVKAKETNCGYDYHVRFLSLEGEEIQFTKIEADNIRNKLLEVFSQK